jgi:O-acetyl-ADP-ribose deacetylase (regulator of RNase III)
MTKKIEILRGDITQLKVDAIVNAANSSLLGGGGVDGAIHRKGGPAILEACRKIVAKQGGCKTGEAVITTAGLLPAGFVIHTVGPFWNGGNKNEAVLLESCYKKSLQTAVANNIKTIAFPNISTGIYGFPKEAACRIALNTVTHFLLENHALQKVVFVCFDDENYSLYQTIYNKGRVL